MPTLTPELKKLDYFAGTWVLEGEMKPGPMSSGGKMRETNRNQWMDGGFFLIVRSEFETPMGNGSGFGKPPVMGTVNNRGASVLESIDEANSTDLLSGVQPMATSGSGCAVSLFGTPPSAGMTYTSTLPS